MIVQHLHCMLHAACCVVCALVAYAVPGGIRWCLSPSHCRKAMRSCRIRSYPTARRCAARSTAAKAGCAAHSIQRPRRWMDRPHAVSGACGTVGRPAVTALPAVVGIASYSSLRTTVRCSTAVSASIGRVPARTRLRCSAGECEPAVGPRRQDRAGHVLATVSTRQYHTVPVP